MVDQFALLGQLAHRRLDEDEIEPAWFREPFPKAWSLLEDF
jgi:hypothetical protein